MSLFLTVLVLDFVNFFCAITLVHRLNEEVMSLFLTVFRLRQISSGTIIPTCPIKCRSPGLGFSRGARFGVTTAPLGDTMVFSWVGFLERQSHVTQDD
jgi:hypothetical protein